MLSCSITQHLSTVEEEASAGEKLNLGFPRHARSSRDVHRITGRKQIWSVRHKPSISGDIHSAFTLYFTRAVPLMWKTPMFMRSRNGDFCNVQMFTDLLSMKKSWGKWGSDQQYRVKSDYTFLCILALHYKNENLLCSYLPCTFYRSSVGYSSIKPQTALSSVV